jgi:uncharacterized membrane protein (UPF0127 family)
MPMWGGTAVLLALSGLTVGVASWFHRVARGKLATALVVVLVFTAVWLLSAAVYVPVESLDLMVTLLKVRAALSSLSGLAWFVFALYYTGREHWLSRPVQIGIGLLAAALVVIPATNHRTGWFGSEATKVSEPVPHVETSLGPLSIPVFLLVTLLVVVGLLLLAAGFWLTSPTGPLADILHPLEYEEATLDVTDENGSDLATVDVRIADTERERYVGLSQTDSLDDDEGMLFVFPEAGEHEFVMRDMAFPLDIVFVAPNGTITTIRHAPVPPEGTAAGDLTRYPGTGKYVLEVPRGFTNRTGIDVGDEVAVPEGVDG